MRVQAGKFGAVPQQDPPTTLPGNDADSGPANGGNSCRQGQWGKAAEVAAQTPVVAYEVACGLIAIAEPNDARAVGGSSVFLAAGSGFRSVVGDQGVGSQGADPEGA